MHEDPLLPSPNDPGSAAVADRERGDARRADTPCANICAAPPLPPAADTIIQSDLGMTLAEFGAVCHLPIGELLEGQSVLVLGCEAGHGAYVVSRLVGPGGRVIALDADREQLDAAATFVASRRAAPEAGMADVRFTTGSAEDLAAVGIADDSIDVALSTCAFNGCADKRAALGEIFRVLCVGGELRLSTVFADRRLGAETATRAGDVCACLGGALYLEDFRRLLASAGVPDYRVVAATPVEPEGSGVLDEVLDGVLADAALACSTVCAFKLPDTLEDICEQYGQMATYLGTIPGHPRFFDLDDHHRFFAGRASAVCGNTASMVQDTRYGPHFTVAGDRLVHQGRFIGC